MRDIKDLIDEWIFEIDELIELARATAKNWWWLDNGEKPFVRVNVMKLHYKRHFPFFWRKLVTPEFILSDLLSPHMALTIVKENLEKSKELKGIYLARALLKIKEDVNDITQAINAAKEADRIMETLSSLLDKVKNLAESSKYERTIRSLMKEVIETVVQNYRNWEEKKKDILSAVEVIKKEVEKAPVVEKVEEKPEVVEKVEEEEVETA